MQVQGVLTLHLDAWLFPIVLTVDGACVVPGADARTDVGAVGRRVRL
ncbi:hypothetical protein ACFY3O_26185 [Streptomyces sp. NPDC001046]